MARDSWFRRSTWSPSDRADFAAHMRRSRTAGARAQYLRIQAFHLQHVGPPGMYEAGLELLDQLLEECPERTQLSSAHEQRAECLFQLGRVEEAIAAYRAALEAERNFPNVHGLAYLGFAELVLKLERRKLFPEALSVLAEFSGYELVPINLYRLSAALALLFEAAGEMAKAKSYAQAALAAASAEQSGLRYHQDLGLVVSPDPEQHARLMHLAED